MTIRNSCKINCRTYQCQIYGCTQPLKLKACFYVQIKLVFWKLFFIKSMQKLLNSFGIWESHSLFFILNVSKNHFVVFWSNSKASFKITGCWFFPKHVMSKKNFLFKSQKELYIFYNYANRTKLFSGVYYQKEGVRP